MQRQMTESSLNRVFIIHRSESPSQVYVFATCWLFALLKLDPGKDLKRCFLFYDNMCNLDRFRCTKEKLPLPPPFDSMFININKLIDDFHLRNHKNPSCRQNYSSEKFKKMHPDKAKTKNSSVCEQLFVWLGRFHKNLNSMTKRHFLFYLHRMVVRRNKYTERQYRNGKKPLLPGRKKRKRPAAHQ